MAVMPSGSGGRIELPENVVVSRLDAFTTSPASAPRSSGSARGSAT